MKLDITKYDRDIFIEGEHFYEKKVALDEVIRGKSEKLHRNSFVSRNEAMDNIRLNLSNFRFVDRKSFNEDGEVEKYKRISADASVDVGTALGLSYFGTARLIKNIEVIFVHGSENKNQITLYAVSVVEATYDDSEPDALQVRVKLKKKNFDELWTEAHKQGSDTILQLTIDLEGSWGIYEPWNPTGEFKSRDIIKLLTRQVLEATEAQNSTELKSINDLKLHKFELLWIDANEIEPRDEEEIDDTRIEWMQSRGSEQQKKIIQSRNRQPWLKRNWFWPTIIIVALVSYLRRQ